ncbi:hypothetical protein LINGRAHAP2_LOCUS1643 [Linum grandiflorum]
MVLPLLGIKDSGKFISNWIRHVLLLLCLGTPLTMLDIGPAFEKRVNFWTAIEKFQFPIFIEKATLLRISLLTTGTLLILDFMLFLPSLALF